MPIRSLLADGFFNGHLRLGLGQTGRYQVGYLGNVGGRISRADVADFMLKQATDTTYLRQLPLVGS